MLRLLAHICLYCCLWMSVAGVLVDLPSDITSLSHLLPFKSTPYPTLVLPSSPSDHVPQVISLTARLKTSGYSFPPIHTCFLPFGHGARLPSFGRSLWCKSTIASLPLASLRNFELLFTPRRFLVLAHSHVQSCRYSCQVVYTCTHLPPPRSGPITFNPWNRCWPLVVASTRDSPCGPRIVAPSHHSRGLMAQCGSLRLTWTSCRSFPPTLKGGLSRTSVTACWAVSST